jgi:hypothetical protein
MEGEIERVKGHQDPEFQGQGEEELEGHDEEENKVE